MPEGRPWTSGIEPNIFDHPPPHPPTPSPQVMMRSGQPLTGTNGRRCKEDERLINATLRPGKRGYVIDTRTISVAQQAKARGGGFETEANYPQWRRIHKAIERWVLTRDSDTFHLFF